MKHLEKENKSPWISRLFLMLLSTLFIFQICAIPLPGETEGNTGKNSNNNYSIDHLIAPSSPAFALLGKEPTSIIRPETGADLALSILNQTGNLATIPDDFAIEFLPAWLFWGNKITFDGIIKDKNPLDVLWQTLSISIATKLDTSEKEKNTSSINESSSENSDTENKSRFLSVGIRFSLLRGKLKYEKELDKILKKTGNYNIALNENMKADFELQNWKSERAKGNQSEELTKKIEDRQNEIEKKTTREQAQEAVSKVNFERTRLNLNIAGGVVWKFPGNKFEGGKMNKWGIWTTLSYELEKVNWNFLALGRYLSMEADEDSIKKNCFDIGGRVIYDSLKNYSISGEFVYRKYNKNENENDTNQWRLALILEYNIGKNQMIHVTFGRDFEGNEKGNILTMIGFKIGLGSMRPILNKTD